MQRARTLHSTTCLLLFCSTYCFLLCWPLLQNAIDDYLTEQLTGGSFPEASSSPKPKRQRTAAAAAAAAPGSSSNAGAPEGGIMLDTQGLKWASVSDYKGQQYVNLRNYFRVRVIE